MNNFFSFDLLEVIPAGTKWFRRNWLYAVTVALLTIAYLSLLPGGG